MSGERLNEAELLPMIDRVLAGEPRAWQELMAQLFPHLVRYLHKSSAMGDLRRSDDHCRNAATGVLEKLAARGHHALRFLREQRQATNSDLQFAPWLWRLVANHAHDYRREHQGTGTAAAGVDDTLKKRALGTLVNEMPPDDQAPGVRPPVTSMQWVNQILEMATQQLSPEQLMVFEAWMKDEDLGKALESSRQPRESDAALEQRGARLLRAAQARLRRYYESL